jgi:hypothetical protein
MKLTKEIRAAHVATGRIGGSAKVKKGFAMLTPAERKAIGKAAAAKRWGKKK